MNIHELSSRNDMILTGQITPTKEEPPVGSFIRYGDEGEVEIIRWGPNRQ